MSRDLRYALQFTAEDKASAKVEKLNRTAARGAKAVSDQNKKSAQDTTRANEQVQKSSERTAQVQERAAQRGRTAGQRMAQDRERLGIRSEERVRREITVTEGAYRRLAQTGRLSAMEQARAFQQMQNRVAGLRRELQATGREQSRLGRGFGVGSMIGLGAGVIGAAHTLSRPVGRTMDFEQRLAYMANTAYSDRNTAGRREGMAEMRGVIERAAGYGGTRDGAAEALDKMLASGAIKKDTALNLLPLIQKSAVATGSSTEQLANIAVRAKQNYNISDADFPRMFDMAAQAGKEGGFEIRDMAKWLPELMGASGTTGMTGLNDFKTLLTAAQASMITAGSTDAAGNNLRNLLLKINSQDTQKDAAKLEWSKGKSIDLTGTLSAARGKGINSLDAFVGIVDKVIGGDKNYQQLQKKIHSSTANSPEQMEAMDAQTKLLQGTAIGKLIQDQQALMALVGYMNKGYVRQVSQGIENNRDTIDKDYDVIAGTDKNKTDRFNNARFSAEFDAFSGFNKQLGDTSLKLAEYAKQYPELTKYAIGAGYALSSLAVAAGGLAVGGALQGWMMRRGGAAAAGSIAGVSSGTARTATRGIGIGAAGTLGILADGTVNFASNPSAEGAASTLRQAGGWMAGAGAGARMGAPFGPWGAAAGGVLGGLGGSYLMDTAGKEISNAIQSFLSSPVQPKLPPAQQFQIPQLPGLMGQPGGNGNPLGVVDLTQLSAALHEATRSAVEQARQTPQALDIRTTVAVENGSITAAVNAANSVDARRQ